MTREEVPVVWINPKEGERCAGCGEGVGELILIGRSPGIRCLKCGGLADLVYLGAGDAALTRRSTALSLRHAVVVKFSRARKRDERQGVLVEAAALERARQSCAADAAKRVVMRAKRRVRDEAADREYVALFSETILRQFPACPQEEAESIARHACLKHSGRVGRSRAAKEFDPKAVELAVRAHLRHVHTRYDALLMEGLRPAAARPLILVDLESVAALWRRGRAPR